MNSMTHDLRSHGYVRPLQGGWVTGTCVALARGAGLSVGVVRLLVVLTVLATSGWAALLYLAAAIVLPRELPMTHVAPATPATGPAPHA